MQFKKPDIAAYAKENGLEFVQCNSTHWKIKGGIAVVNLHVGREGITLYVQGMAKGRPMCSLADIVVAAKQISHPKNARARRKKSYRGIKRRKWKAASKSGEPRCHWCQMPFDSFEQATADHVVPLSKGGSNGDDNIVLSCDSCNQIRADRVTENDIRQARKQTGET